MRVPLTWLKEYIKFTHTPTQLADILTMIGLEVESIEMLPPTFEGVVVGRILATERHPNADNLTLAKVETGRGVVDVVCGAENCRAGIKTAFAPVGASLTDEEGKTFKIRKAKLRGIESEGMLCSPKELKLSENGKGIVELPEELEVGKDLAEVYNEVVLEIGLTPNLGHCASILGVVRELSAAIDVPYSKPKIFLSEDKELKISSLTKVDNQEKELCPRYSCRIIQGVKVGPSPLWLQRKLMLAGIRSINNVVDVTNFVLLEMGQPLHAFDLDKLDGHQIIVRKAKEGEKIVTLDAKQYSLTQEMLVIADKSKPVALAGIMGGLESEVSLNSVNILLEAALFNPRTIRRTAKQLGLQTEGSRRHERGIDPNQVVEALDRAAALIQEVAGGKIALGLIDNKSSDFLPRQVSCRVDRVRKVLGAHLSSSEIENVFARLQFPYKWENQNTLTVEVPTYRNDIQSEIDLIEEVARVFGFDNISEHAVLNEPCTLPHAPIFLFERETRSRLISEGLQEFLTCDLVGPSLLQIVDPEALKDKTLIHVMNPRSVEQSILRPSLLPGLLSVIKNNFDHQTKDISGFEIGRIHFKQDEENYREQSAAGIILTGKNRPHHWDSKPDDVDFFDIKGILENTLRGLGVQSLQFEVSTLQAFHPGRQATILSDGIALGYIGEVHPAVLRQLDVPQDIYYAEINLHEVAQVRKTGLKMRELPHFPSSERDWTITLYHDFPIGDALAAIRSISSPLLESATLLDVYCSERVGKERKNVTFHFVYRDRNKTVSQEEVDAEHARITQEVLRILGKAVV
jgi:phenylalanyl-tRNA synthetase beta chain